ncbi:MAG: hypothetical protein RLZZ546_478 [Bacteroidota bacterium]|jgi:tetratricopeptide (TPR) repeat protein
MFIAFYAAKSQTIDEEIGFKYVKAEYLISTERFEDAIRELNDVIKTNPVYKNALLLRAETKFRLAAYKGAKLDAIEFITSNGITGKAASILGKSEFNLNSYDASLNSLTAAIALGEKEVKLFEMRAEIYEMKNQKISACEDWQTAAKMGSTKGAINAKKNCGIKIDPPVVNNPPKDDNDSVPPTSDNTDTGKEDQVINVGHENKDTTIVEANTGNTVPVETNTQVDSTKTTENNNSDILIPEEDDSVNSIEIDEELTLDIYGQGLGKRAIVQRPSILILAEKDGVVAIEFCVNDKGLVEYADFLPSKSTLNQNSLVSLAIRKTKEFWFEDSEYPKQCGIILFKIKGS